MKFITKLRHDSNMMFRTLVCNIIGADSALFDFAVVFHRRIAAPTVYCLQVRQKKILIRCGE